LQLIDFSLTASAQRNTSACYSEFIASSSRTHKCSMHKTPNDIDNADCWR